MGVKLWVLIVTSVLVFLLLIVIVTFICHVYCRRRRRKRNRRSDDREAAMPEGVSTEMEVNVKKSSDGQVSQQGSETTQNSIVTDLENSAGRYSPAAVKDGSTRSILGLEEIASATDGFSEENVISIEDYGVDYFGNLADDTKVIVKIFNANNRYGLFLYLNLINDSIKS